MNPKPVETHGRACNDYGRACDDYGRACNHLNP